MDNDKNRQDPGGSDLNRTEKVVATIIICSVGGAMLILWGTAIVNLLAR